MKHCAQLGGGSAKPDAPITFDESDFPSLGGAPARPAGVTADGGTTNPGGSGGGAGGPAPITAASATLGPDPYVALSLGKGQEFNMQVWKQNWKWYYLLTFRTHHSMTTALSVSRRLSTRQILAYRLKLDDARILFLCLSILADALPAAVEWCRESEQELCTFATPSLLCCEVDTS